MKGRGGGGGGRAPWGISRHKIFPPHLQSQNNDTNSWLLVAGASIQHKNIAVRSRTPIN